MKSDDLPMIMSAKDAQKLGLPRAMVYNLMNRSDVPVLSIGRRKFLHRDKFLEWLEVNAMGYKHVV